MTEHKSRFTKFGIFFTIGCLLPILIILFSPLILWGVYKLNKIDNEWIETGISNSFEKKEFLFETFCYPIEEIIIEDENTFTLFGTNPRTTKYSKPIFIRTTDGGDSWKKTEIDMKIKSAFFDHFGDSVFMMPVIEKNDSVYRVAYVSKGNFEKWEYLGKAFFHDGSLYVNKNDSLPNDKSFVIERGNIASLDEDNLCNWNARYASNNKNWVACGYDNSFTSTHETRIVYKSERGAKVRTSFPNKRHPLQLEVMEPTDFFVQDDVMAGVFTYRKSSMISIDYLYYSVNGGKKWYDEKIPLFSHTRLLVTEEKIIVFGVDELYAKGRGKITILSLPIPKK